MKTVQLKKKESRELLMLKKLNHENIINLRKINASIQFNNNNYALYTGWPGCLVLKQGAVDQLFLGVFLMFLACLDHARWAKFHLGILGPQEWKKSSDIFSWKRVTFQDLLKLTFFWQTGHPIVSNVQLQQLWRGAGVCTTHTSLNHESGGWRGPITLYIVDMEQMVTLYIVDIWSPCTL